MTNFNKNTALLSYRNQTDDSGRLRVSNQTSLGSYNQHMNNMPELFTEEVLGTATSVYGGGGLIGGSELRVGINFDVVVRQSIQWHNYFPGKTQKIELTASGFNTEPGTTKRMGYYSSRVNTPFGATLDGLCFEADGISGDIQCNIYREGSIVFSQAIDMNNPELLNFDPSFFNFYVIDFLYLGGVAANFWIQTEFGMTKVATYSHSNQDASAFIGSPNQPVRYEIRSDGGTGVFNQICSDVATESIINESSTKNYSTGITASSGLSGMIIGTRYALLGVRIQNRQDIIQLKSMSVLSDSNDNLLVEVIVGGTLAGGGPTFTDIPITTMQGFTGSDQIAVQGWTLSDLVHSDGSIITSEFVASTATASPLIGAAKRLGWSIDGRSEIAYLCVTPSANAAKAFGSLSWREFF